MPALPEYTVSDVRHDAWKAIGIQFLAAN